MGEESLGEFHSLLASAAAQGAREGGHGHHAPHVLDAGPGVDSFAIALIDKLRFATVGRSAPLSKRKPSILQFHFSLSASNGIGIKNEEISN